MYADLEPTAPPTRRAPIGVAGHLREAIGSLSQGLGTVLRQSERPWASITFEGARHSFEIAFEGARASLAGERFIAALPDHEFTIPGQIVAEATVTEVDHCLVPEPRLTVTCELLLLRDA